MFAACHRGEEESQAVVSVRVTTAQIAPIAQPIDVAGTIAARQEATISSKISAQIAEMPLLKNQNVRRGEVLAQLESRDLAAQRSEAAAAVRDEELGITLTSAEDQKSIRDAEATLTNAQKTYERRKTLFENGGISKKDLEASQLEVTKAENDLHLAERASSLHRGTTKAQQARERLAALDAQFGYATIRAPFDGIVTEQFHYRGDFAPAGEKLLTIADTSNVIVKAALSDESASRVKSGDAATVQPDDLPGVTLKGRVDLVARSADPQSRAVELWILLPNPNGRLRPNSAARVRVASGNIPDAVVIPASAVTLDATNSNAGTMMIVDAHSVAHEVHVTIGVHTRERVQVTSGLHGGETVIVEGNYSLPDGTKVEVAR